MKLFTICNVSTGECRGGMVLNDDDVEKQILGPGESILVGVQAHHIEDKAIFTAGKVQIVKRAAADIASRRPSPPEVVDQMDVLLDALKAKGVTISPADLTAARGRLKQSKGAV